MVVSSASRARSAPTANGILAAVELGLSNLKLEGLNSKIRLINHQGYGHHSPAALISMIYLCCGGITVDLPTGR
jgi:transposase